MRLCVNSDAPDKIINIVNLLSKHILLDYMFNGELDKPTYTWPYAVTITLKPQVRRDTAEYQYDKYASYVVTTIKELFPECILTLVCELTKSFDIHFHGTICFKKSKMRGNVVNVPKWFSDKFRGNKTIGYVLLKVVDDSVKWNDYIMKSITEFEATTLRKAIVSQTGG